MSKLTMAQALNLALAQEMAKDDSVLVLGEDVGVDGGVFRVTEGLLGKFGENRVMDTPLAESAIVGGMQARPRGDARGQGGGGGHPPDGRRPSTRGRSPPWSTPTRRSPGAA